MKLTAHQCYVKSVKEKLTNEEYKQLLKDNNVIIGLRSSFTDMLKNKYPEVNVEDALLIFETQQGFIMTDNPVEILKSDLNKHFLIAVLDEYSKKYRYDFSKSCQCESSPGETWCCNHCGLPTVGKTGL